MQFDLRTLFSQEGERLSVEYDLDMSKFEEGEESPFESLVHIKGEIVNRSGITTVSYEADFEYVRPCDRCDEELIEDMHYSFSHVLLPSLEDETDDEIIEVPGCILDMDELAYSDILLGLPTKYLCSEDCKGICPVCGMNLNDGDCDCEIDNVDPRLAALRDLL